MLTPAELDAIIAAIRQREVPPQLQTFVQGLAKSRQAPRSWLGRLMFGRLDRPVRCESVTVYPGLAGLRRSLVFDAGVDAQGLLEWGALPGHNSHGTFAVRADGFHYLNRDRAEVEALLGEEPEALAESDPPTLAAFLVEVLGRRLNASHEVLLSVDHLERYPRDHGLDGYALDRREWARVRARFTAPTRRHEPWGSRLDFCTVHGWMHAKRRLTHQGYIIELASPSPDVHGYREHPRCLQAVRLHHAEQILSENIFARLPRVRY